ncbi:MAG: valine--tRNA ligase [Elusimicrobia bacterium]|nr:valine--tRNA ligase [Elusimicrobiota bacterium]
MLEKAYDPSPVEAKWVKAWDAAKLFKSAPAAKRKSYTIVIPPPNVTGALHLGHALNNALQDVLIRWRRLHGDETCWVPGTDHGGIATQNVMEKQLKKDGKTRHDLGRERFLEKMQEWTKDCKNTILGQLRRLGCALDWDREAFTMDEVRAKSVFESFKRLWAKGLIYRGERMVNWCVRCGTALSDIEVEHEERKGHLWHIHYPATDAHRDIVVATTRPETMLGDTAVAVHPDDERYKGLIGAMLKLPLTDYEIPVIADDQVDKDFGTGAVKVTPAHDPNDYEIMLRHPTIGSRKVIGFHGELLPEAGKNYAGLSREKAREKVVADLKASGLLEKVDDHRHAVGVCYRCGSVIEPLLSWQWFVKQIELAKAPLAALEAKKFVIHPESWAKPYRDWLVNIKDWCISRQIWWGHRIPVWYCLDCNDISNKEIHQLPDLVCVVSLSKPEACPKCGGKKGNFSQDPDVLDTWFSSALWPMSVFGWPDKTGDLDYYYPTSILVTGYEILYLWVARMQMMGLEFMGKVPFTDALIHGIVRDKSGKKMSKSLGNVIDPLEMMDKYGTDALRFALLIQARPGKDIPFSEESLTGARNFANKLWNSTRFVLMNLPESPSKPYEAPNDGHCCRELVDDWILAEYKVAIRHAEAAMSAHDPAGALAVLYEFLWDTFCAWYVELAKNRLQGPEGESKEAARAILVHVLNGTLKLLHPFMPFITEELYAALKPYAGESARFLLDASVPTLDDVIVNDMDSPRQKMRTLSEVTIAIRTLRSQLNVPPDLKISVIASGGQDREVGLLKEHQDYIKPLARIERITIDAKASRPPHSATAVAAGMSFFVPLEGVIDFAKERERLQKELVKAEDDVKKIASKVENKDFIARAPESEVALARSQHKAALERQSRLKETLAILS